MKFLHDLVNKVKPNFMPGGKLSFLEFTFDAFETFLFVPDKTTKKGAHIRDTMDCTKTNYN